MELVRKLIHLNKQIAIIQHDTISIGQRMKLGWSAEPIPRLTSEYLAKVNVSLT
jgi:hypothetical protein